MTISDPIGDMLNRIRTALLAGHTSTSVPNSKIKVSIADIIKSKERSCAGMTAPAHGLYLTKVDY